MKNINLPKALLEPLSFEKATQYFGSKTPVTKEEFYKIDEEYRSKAFTVSGYSSGEVLRKFYTELDKSIRSGTTMEDFRKNMNDFLIRRGYEGLTPFQSDNIYRTNVQTAFGVGHYKTMTKPMVKKLRPYWMYDAVDDSHTRHTHMALDGKAYHADHEFWDTWYPPNGYK